MTTADSPCPVAATAGLFSVFVFVIGADADFAPAITVGTFPFASLRHFKILPTGPEVAKDVAAVLYEIVRLVVGVVATEDDCHSGLEIVAIEKPQVGDVELERSAVVCAEKDLGSGLASGRVHLGQANHFTDGVGVFFYGDFLDHACRLLSGLYINLHASMGAHV